MAKTPRRRTAGRTQGPSATSSDAGRAGRVSGASRDQRGGGSGDGGFTTATGTAPTPRPGGRGFRPFGWLARLRPRAVGDIIAELRKVTWPTPGDTRYLTFVVAVVAIIMGLLLGAFDLAFGWIIERLFFD